MFFPELMLVIAAGAIAITVTDAPTKHYPTQPQCEMRLMQMVTATTQIATRSGVEFRIVSAKCSRVR